MNEYARATLSVFNLGRQKCGRTVSADNIGQRVDLCVTGFTGFSHNSNAMLLSVICCMLIIATVINTGLGLLLVFSALLLTQIIPKQVEKGEFLRNAEVSNPEKTTILGNIQNSREFTPGKFRMAD